jgi:hypothetical protein
MKNALFVALAIMLFPTLGGRSLAGDPPPQPGEGDSRRVEVKGILQTGLIAIGGETTGTAISVDGKTYELDFRRSPKLQALAETLNKRTAIVQGALQRRMGVERGERWIIMVTGLQPATAQKESPVPPKALTIDTYSGYFVSNKFEPDATASFVVISSQEQFDQVFGAAFVMGDKSHRLPKDAFQSLLVVAAIKRGKATWEYKVEGASQKAGVVELRYAATETKSDSATFACPLIVSIPKGQYKAIQFVENGKPVKQVEIGGK